MKRTYELMIVAKPDVVLDTDKKQEALVLGLAKGATIKQLTMIGKKELAYPIKKYTEGQYILAMIEGDSLEVSKLEETIKLGSDVIRYLLIAQPQPSKKKNK